MPRAGPTGGEWLGDCGHVVPPDAPLVRTLNELAAHSVGRLDPHRPVEMEDWRRSATALNAIQNPLANGELERVARTLAISRPGVTIEGLSDVLSDIADLEAVLMSSHMFVEVASGKWALGRSASSMRPAPPAPV